MSAEYHEAHLSFARAGIVEAAANREPILDRLLAYTADVEQAERERVVARIRHSADVIDGREVSGTARTLNRMALLIEAESTGGGRTDG